MDKIDQIWQRLAQAKAENSFEDIEIGAELLAHEAKCLRLEQEQKEGVAV